MQASGGQLAKARLASTHENNNNQTKDSQESCAPAMATEGKGSLVFFHLSMANYPGD